MDEEGILTDQSGIINAKRRGGAAAAQTGKSEGAGVMLFT